MREMVEKLAPESVPYLDSQNLGETVRVRIAQRLICPCAWQYIAWIEPRDLACDKFL